jgi:hypothetical protein
MGTPWTYSDEWVGDKYHLWVVRDVDGKPMFQCREEEEARRIVQIVNASAIAI